MDSTVPVAIMANGEFVCRNCCNKHELQVLNDETLDDEITVVFPLDINLREDNCGRCLNMLIDCI